MQLLAQNPTCFQSQTSQPFFIFEAIFLEKPWTSLGHEHSKLYCTWLKLGISNKLKKNSYPTQFMLWFWR